MKKYSKKGVSPVIATVLLIAIIIVIALIIFLWLKGLTEEAVTKFDKNVELVCEDIGFDSSYSGGELVISNIGNVPIYEIKIKIQKDRSFEIKNIRDLLNNNWPEKGLNPGRVFSEAIDIGVDAQSIIIIPVLIGSAQSGEQAYTCDESRFGKEIIL